MGFAGTYINFKIIEYLLSTKPSSIPFSVSSQLIRVDDLIIFEQKVNLVCTPLILWQLLRLLFPFMKEVLGNTVIVSIMETCGVFAMLHRAIGGFGIAGVRQVLFMFLGVGCVTYL